MISRFSKYALLMVAPLVLGSCTERTVLHGMRTPSAPIPVSNDIRVWFVKSQAGQLQMVPVVRKSAGPDRLEQAVAELLKGPTTKEEQVGLGTEIPRGTILLGMNKHGNSVEVDLSNRFAKSGGSTSFETRLDQLRKTVSGATGLDVYLNVEGKRLNVEQGEGIEIHQPLNH